MADNSTTTPPPTTPATRSPGQELSAGAARGIKSGTDAIGGAGAKGLEVGKDAVAKVTEKSAGEHAEDAKNKAKKFYEDLDFGKILSGGAFALLGYMFAGIFGEGFMGSIASVLLPVGMFFMGLNNGFGDTINGWLGRPKSSDRQAAAPGQQLQRDGAGQGQGQSAPAPSVDASQNRAETKFTPEMMVAMLESVDGTKYHKDRLSFSANKNQVVMQPVALADNKGVDQGVYTKDILNGAFAECKASGSDGIVFNAALGSMKPNCGPAR